MVTGGAVTRGRKGGRHKKSSPTPRGFAQGVSNHINGAMPHVKASRGGDNRAHALASGSAHGA